MTRRTIILVAAAIVVAVLAAATPPAVAGTPRVCAYCGHPIQGAYFEAGGVFYHPDHFLCAYCGRPIHGAYTEYKGAHYHTACFRQHVALRCALCGGIIEGDYILDYWGNAYHLSHQGVAPCCDSCGRFISPTITGGGVRYDDGRYICAICERTAVTDIHDILALIDTVAADLSGLGMTVDYHGMRVHLIGRDQMQRLSGEHSPGLRGFTDYSHDWRLFNYAGNRHIDVFFLYGMPRMELISTIAHELTHIYMFNHGRFHTDRAFTEGSCNYASFLVLGDYPSPQSSFFRVSMEREDDPVYGEGFRRVKRYAEEQGTDVWLRRLASKKHLPDGY